MSSHQLTFRTATLGCKVNQYETEWLGEGLRRLGYRRAERGQSAGLCIVNTCTVTGTSDVKSRKLIRQIAKSNPDARIIVMGCYATRAADEVAELPNVWRVVTDKSQLPDLLLEMGLEGPVEAITTFGERHRAYIKVQDGCRQRCAYCIIPTVRPVLKSRPIDEVVTEVRGLIDAGFREVVLTGIHLGHYGIDFAKGDIADTAAEGPNATKASPRLHDLVERLISIDGNFRLRLSSLEAVEVTDELIELIRDNPEHVCPHLHLSMQSGSDDVLRRMQRRWLSGPFIQRCREISQALDQPALTTDVIVGFPGETEDNFRQTCEAVRACGFSKIHIFRFSPREGTPAATMPDQIPGNVKADRAARLAELEGELRRNYFKKLIGRPMQVLIEERLPGTSDKPPRLVGTSARYAPVEIMLNDAAPTDPSLIQLKESASPDEPQPGSFITVTATELRGDRLVSKKGC